MILLPLRSQIFPMLNYPLKFRPILKEKIWGGNKLENLLHKKADGKRMGESWEISAVEENISVVANGRLEGKSLKDLLGEHRGNLVGGKIYEKFKEQFPLLIKFIDADTALSVQLHPNDDLARERHSSFGKTEMWYIMQADEGAQINIGFKESISEAEYLKYLNSGKITDVLHFEKVKRGDTFYINPGKVHAIGAGVLLAEIQQTSDITYRIFDWNRTDEQGNSRELHTALALKAIDFEKRDDFKRTYSEEKNQSNTIVSCPYFTTNFLPVTGRLEKDYAAVDSFVIFMCVSGTAEISVDSNSEVIQQGQTVLIPAENKKVEIFSEGSELLEVYI